MKILSIESCERIVTIDFTNGEFCCSYESNKEEVARRRSGIISSDELVYVGDRKRFKTEYETALNIIKNLNISKLFNDWNSIVIMSSSCLPNQYEQFLAYVQLKILPQSSNCTITLYGDYSKSSNFAIATLFENFARLQEYLNIKRGGDNPTVLNGKAYNYFKAIKSDGVLISGNIYPVLIDVIFPEAYRLQTSRKRKDLDNVIHSPMKRVDWSYFEEEPVKSLTSRLTD